MLFVFYGFFVIGIFRFFSIFIKGEGFFLLNSVYIWWCVWVSVMYINCCFLVFGKFLIGGSSVFFIIDFCVVVGKLLFFFCKLMMMM